ncbi:MAG: acyl-CoA dehydrogenase family protein [Lachnospiraceae bacterium]|nr:acyl-CoA dehydrogenase family protein [Lachnospiraceae bacterium]
MILSDKYELIKKNFRRFAEKEFTTEIQENLDRNGGFNWEIWEKIGKYGFTGVKIPTQYGGQGGDYMAYALMNEEFCRVCPVLGIYANTPNSLGGGPLLQCGNEEQRQKYLAPAARGEKQIVFALTEPGAGSDPGSMTTKAVADGDYYVINGRKCFISGAPIADYAIVYARTDLTQKGGRGISMFIVDLKLKGVSFGKPEAKMGINGYPTSDIVFENVYVHKDDLLGPLHKGYAVAMKTLDGGRLGVAAQALGAAQGAFEEAVAYVKERKQFGKPIYYNQGVSFMLAEMATEIEATRNLVYSAAEAKDHDASNAATLCSMAKLYATEMANKVCGQAIQLHGGYGYIKDYKVERLYRDVRVMTLYEGTSQVQKIVISRDILK